MTCDNVLRVSFLRKDVGGRWHWRDHKRKMGGWVKQELISILDNYIHEWGCRYLIYIFRNYKRHSSDRKKDLWFRTCIVLLRLGQWARKLTPGVWPFFVFSEPLETFRQSYNNFKDYNSPFYPPPLLPDLKKTMQIIKIITLDDRMK